MVRGFGLTFSTAGHTDRETKWDKSKLQCQRGCHNQTSDSTVNKNSKQVNSTFGLLKLKGNENYVKKGNTKVSA